MTLLGSKKPAPKICEKCGEPWRAGTTQCWACFEEEGRRWKASEECRAVEAAKEIENREEGAYQFEHGFLERKLGYPPLESLAGPANARGVSRFELLDPSAPEKIYTLMHDHQRVRIHVVESTYCIRKSLQRVEHDSVERFPRLKQDLIPKTPPRNFNYELPVQDVPEPFDNCDRLYEALRVPKLDPGKYPDAGLPGGALIEPTPWERGYCRGFVSNTTNYRARLFIGEREIRAQWNTHGNMKPDPPMHLIETLLDLIRMARGEHRKPKWFWSIFRSLFQ